MLTLKHPTRLAVCCLVIASAVRSTFAAVPGLINFQSRLSDSAGAPLNETGTLAFRIYDAASGGVQLASGAVAGAAVNGLVSGQLPAWAGVFSGPNAWLEVEFDNEILSPRSRLAAVPYAFQAELASDPARVAKAGDTMTGQLALPANGLAVGVSQLVLSGGNVGVGTSAPGLKFAVHGDANAIEEAVGDGGMWLARLRNDTDGFATAPHAGVLFSASNRPGAFMSFAGIDGGKENATEDHNAGELRFFTRVGQYGALTEKMHVTSNGNVGIGTTDTQNVKLRVAGNEALNNNNALYWRNAADTGYSAGVYSTGSDDVRVIAGGADKVTVLPSGNVGIGTTAASDRLEVVGNIRLSYGAKSILFSDPGNYDFSINHNSGASLDIRSPEYGGGTTIASFANSGNVGIGTTAPVSKLHIKGVGDGTALEALRLHNNGDSLNTAVSQSFYVGLGGAGTGGVEAARLEAANDVLGKASFRFYTQGNAPGGLAERMRITGAGYVGIGTTNPGRQLEVAANAPSSAMTLNNTSAAGRKYSIFSSGTGAAVTGALAFYDDAAAAYRAIIDPSGNLGLGTTAPQKRLHVVSSDYNPIAVQGLPNTSDAGTTLNAMPNGSFLIGGGSGGAFYIYWKSETGQKYYAALSGTPF